MSHELNELFPGLTVEQRLAAWQKLAKELALALVFKGTGQEDAWGRRNALAAYKAMAVAENVPHYFLSVDKLQ